MKTIALQLYQFGELSELGKEKAIAANADFNVNYSWWEMVYEDAKNIGLQITGFDLDRANYCNGRFTEDAIYTARYIRLLHGEQTDTYQLSVDFQERRDVLVNEWPKDDHGELEQVDDLDAALDTCEEGFLKALCRQYLRILDKEYDYLTSDEAIADTLTANEYWFTADGELATHLEKLAITA